MTVEDRVHEGVRQPEVEVRLCPAGPMLVRGATSVRDVDGESHQVDRPVVAVCRCGKTARAPWCDGTHKLLPPHLRPA
jgi:hypothetical protein